MGIDGVSSVGYGTGSVVANSTPAHPEKTEVSESAAVAPEAPNASKPVAAQKSKSNDKQDEKERFGTEASDEQIKKALDEINKKATQSEAVFGIHEKTNRVTIKIVDKKTKDVIKELPPEKTLDLIAKAWELAGLMVDEKR